MSATMKPCGCCGTPSEKTPCGCCEGVVPITPVSPWNPPGLSAIKYRVGTYGQFRETMVSQLSSSTNQILQGLTARADDDLTIGLLDSFAAVGDVLSFYQERIANEGYLRTATERLSILQLAREIGYELGPGVAASAALAFTLDASGSVASTVIGAGTKVQSVPLQGKTPPEMPQTFETVQSIVAYPEFNSLTPRLTRAQTMSDIETANSVDGMNHIFFAGTATKLSPGDKLLLVGTSGGMQIPMELRTVLSVTPSVSLQQTDVKLATDRLTFNSNVTEVPSPTALITSPSAPTTQNVGELTLSNVLYIIENYPTQSDLVAYLTRQAWDYADFARVVNSYSVALDATTSDVQVFAMRVKAGIFGNNAPAWNSLPTNLTNFPGGNTSTQTFPYGFNWDSPPLPANENSQGAAYDYFFIGSKLNGYVIDIKGANTAQGTQLIAWPQKSSGTDNQLWQLLPDPAGSGYFHIGSKLNGYVIDIKGANTAQGTQLIAWPQKPSGDPNGTDNQLWQLVPDPAGSGYFITSKLNGYVIDIKGANTAPGTELIDWPQKSSGTDNQLWQIMIHPTLVYLSGSFSSISPNQWAVLTDPSESVAGAYPIESVSEASLADFTISAKATGLALDLGTGSFPRFTMRGTTVYAQSEELPLAQIPIPEETPVTGTITGTTLVLNGVVAGLQPGQALAVTGQLSFHDGQTSSETVSEVVTIAKGGVSPYSPGSPFTTITLEAPGLVNFFAPAAVSINANVAPATHGETKNENVGSGDPVKPYLGFSLKQKPLTYVRPIPPASSPTGGVTTLRLWVDDIKWTEAPSLYGLAPDARSYIVRRDDDGTINVLFGNARPAVGIENITAQYRIGTGISGMVAGGQLSLLVSRPLGVKAVTNPLAADGAEDPEDRDHARENAPITVLTLDRIVSLTDVQNFALAFLGIGKALALWSWSDGKKVVSLFVASSTGEAVAIGSSLYQALSQAISDFKDPSIEVAIDTTFQKIQFTIQGNLLVASDRDPNKVSQAVVLAVQQAFSFGARQLARPVHLSDVVGVIQATEGVVAVELKSLSTQTGQTGDLLTCGPNELLVVNPDPDGISLTTSVVG